MVINLTDPEHPNYLKPQQVLQILPPSYQTDKPASAQIKPEVWLRADEKLGVIRESEDRYLCFKAEKEDTLWNCTPVGTVKTIADAEKFLDEQPLEQLGSASEIGSDLYPGRSGNIRSRCLKADECI
jgi:hypothetical protein